MTISKDLSRIILDLISRDYEEDWFEFKVNWFDPHSIGEYISGMSNVAAMVGQENAFIVWGIENETHKVKGTKFDYHTEIRDGEPLEHYLARQLKPGIAVKFEETQLHGKRIVVLSIPKANKIPTSFDRVRYYRIGSSKVNLMDYPERETLLFMALRDELPRIETTESEYQNLTFKKLLTYYGAKGIALNKKTFKKNLGLLTETGKYNILAQLLSDNSHISIRFGIFSGKTKSSTMYAVREFGNDCLLFL